MQQIPANSGFGDFKKEGCKVARLHCVYTFAVLQPCNLHCDKEVSMNKERYVQIPIHLFMELVKFFVIDLEVDRQKISRELEDKLDALVMHEQYTKYKTARTDEERETARKKYLDKKGIHKDFRW